MARISAPSHLTARSRRIFRWVASEHALTSDPAAIALLTEALSALDRAEQARQVVDREGLAVVDRFGQTRPHPLLEVERKARQSFAVLMRELGLNPEVAEQRPPRVTIGGR